MPWFLFFEGWVLSQLFHSPLSLSSWQIDGKQWKQCQTLFWGAPKSLQMVTAAMKLKKTLAPWKKSNDKARQHFEKQRHYFADKGPYSKRVGFSSSHVWMWKLDHKEGWVPKNWCFWIVILEKTLESPLYCKEIKPVNPKQTSHSFEGLMLKLQYFGHPMRRDDSLEKTLMLWKTEGRRRRGRQRMRWLNGIIDSMDISLSKLREIVKAGKPGMGFQSQTQPRDWTTNKFVSTSP